MIMGPHSEDYRSYGSAMQKMAEIVLGNFDFSQIGLIQPIIGSFQVSEKFPFTFSTLLDQVGSSSGSTFSWCSSCCLTCSLPL